MKKIQTLVYPSPCGELLLGAFEGRFCLCDWMIESRRSTIDRRIRQALNADYETGHAEILMRAKMQLDEYFTRQRTVFELPLRLIGTDFQQTVWQALLTIPYGRTCSYGELARRLGNPKAVRAVAAANGANPISIIVPCHRVIGSRRQPVGYAGGVPAKKKLLAWEAESRPLIG